MRTLASIQKINEVKPIPGADRICAYKVLGWWVVDSVGKYDVGDSVVFCTIDSWVPTTIAPFLSKGKEPSEYNGVKGERLRTIRLKGQFSQGLILPISPTCDNIESELFEGLDVTFPLGIQKWEPVIPASLSGQVKGPFPYFAPKTDQERIEGIEHEVFVENKYSLYEVTLKLDGSSCSVYYNDGEVGVCSRNLELKINEENAGNSFIATATSTNLLTALTKLGRNIMVQAEIMGPGIQGNIEKLSKHNFYVFDIYDIDQRRYLTPDERLSVYKELCDFGFTGKHVPIIAFNVTLADINITDVASSKVFVNRPSIYAPMAEGCVFKRMDGQFSFKSINNAFLLKNTNS